MLRGNALDPLMFIGLLGIGFCCFYSRLEHALSPFTEGMGLAILVTKESQVVC